MGRSAPESVQLPRYFEEKNEFFGVFWGFLVPVAMGLGGRYLGQKIPFRRQTFGENFMVGEISEFFSAKMGQGTVAEILSLTGLGGPRIAQSKNWPRPLRFLKN